MASLPCAYCHRVPKARLYTLIWAWQSPDGRVAYKTRSCLACLEPARAALGEALTEEGDYVQLPTSCPRCSEPLLAQEMALTWLTLWDSDGAHKPSFVHCYQCALELHAGLVDAGELMADRPLQNRRRAA